MIKYPFTHIPMKGVGILTLTTIFVLLNYCSLLLAGGTQFAGPVINSAVPNYATTPNRLTILGSNFGTTLPGVKISGTMAVVTSYNDAMVVVQIPAAISATPGSYTLALTRGSDQCVSSTSFDITVGAVGPQGPQGFQGPQGPPITHNLL